MRFETVKDFSAGQSFYVFHHLEVLGEEAGTMQVSARMNKCPKAILAHYRLIKARARHIAV